MTLDLFAFEMLSGRRLTPLPKTSAKWQLTTNADESITCTIPANDQNVKRLRVWEMSTLARNGLLAVVDGLPVAAGPIWRRRYNPDSGHIELTAGGLRSYFNKRVAVPVAASGRSLVDANGDPVTAYDTRVTNMSLGTVAKRYVELARAWPGGAIPMSLPADESRSGRDITVKAIDLKRVGELIDNLSDVINGPDIAFRPRFTEDGAGIYWEMQTGTEAKPRLGSTDALATTWSYGAPKSPAFDLEIDEDGSSHASRFWVSGGSGSDKVISAQAYSSTLIGAGFPLLDGVDAGNSGLSQQSTANDKASQGVKLGQYASSFWSMKVVAHSDRAPKLGEYWLGDLATINIDKREPVLPAGDSVRRIAAISGDESDKSYTIDFAEALV